MKKLIFILMVLFTTVVSAQKQYTIYATQSADWDGSEWVYNDLKSNSMVLTIQGKAVLINDKAHSSYFCHTSNGESSYKAYDEKNRKCLINFIIEDQYSVLTVMYNDFLIRYFYQ
jgi:hypothetical protein